MNYSVVRAGDVKAAGDDVLGGEAKAQGVYAAVPVEVERWYIRGVGVRMHLCMH